MLDPRRRNPGWRPDLPDHRDYRYSASRVDKVDLAVAFRPRMTASRFYKQPITDQRMTSACTGHSSAKEFARERALTPRSPLFTYWNARAAIGETAVDNGAYIRDAIKSLADFGSPRDDLWPDVDVNLFVDPAVPADLDAAKRKNVEYHRLYEKRENILACLSSGHGLVTGVTVYSSIFSPRTDATGIVLKPEPSEPLEGGHALPFGDVDLNFKASSEAQVARNAGFPESLIPAEAICAANSWSERYGQKGHYWFDLAYLCDENLADDTWTIRKI